jgi:hypothetical protein
MGCLSVCSDEEWEFDSQAPRTEWGERDLPKLSLTLCANNPEIRYQRLEVVDWRDYSDPSWRHPEHSLRYRGDLTNPLNKDFKARLNPVLCSSEWPPLRPENGPASKSDSDDESVLPELEVDSDEYGYYGHDGYYNEWEDASHLCCTTLMEAPQATHRAAVQAAPARALITPTRKASNGATVRTTEISHGAIRGSGRMRLT